MESTQPTAQRTTVLAVCLMLGLATLVVALMHGERAIRDSHLRINQEYLKVSVEDRHVVIEQFLSERVNLLKVLLRGQMAALPISQIELQPILNELARTHADYRSLSLWNRDGSLLQRAGDDPLEPGEIIDQEWFQAAVTGGQYISSLYLGSDDKPTLAMAILGQRRDEDHVLRATLRLDSLSHTLAELVVGDTGGTYMVDPVSGTYLSRPHFGGEPLRDRSVQFSWGKKHYHVDYDEHGIEEVDAGTYRRDDGTEVMEAHCCTRQGEWLVVVERDIAEVSHESRALASRLGITILVTLLVLVLITVLGWRYTRR